MQEQNIYIAKYLTIPSLEDFKIGVLTVSVIYFVTLLLNRFFPGTKTPGYILETSPIYEKNNNLINQEQNNLLKPRIYHLNAFRIIILLNIILLFTNYFDNILRNLIFKNFNANFHAANFLGILISLLWLIQGLILVENKNPKLEPFFRAQTLDNKSEKTQKYKPATQEDFARLELRSLLSSFFFGHLWNPKVLGCDFKMYLYLVGALMLNLNIISGLKEYQFLINNSMNNDWLIYVYVLLFIFFICEYCWAEHVHLYTYDIFLERIGFKLTWGCFCFYPFFYCIGIFSFFSPNLDLHSKNSHNNDNNTYSNLGACFSFVLYLFGWILTRGANMQKYFAKTQPDTKRVFLGLIEQRFLPNSNKRIIFSGFWALARHINYLGEILQSVALSIPCFLYSGNLDFVPFLYTFYYIALFFPRAIEDNNLCKQKYGDEIWNSYTEKVPYMMIPYLI